MTRVIEIRTYRLKPGSKEHFHQLMLMQSLPLLQRFGTDVVAFGPSASAEDCYVLIRAYASAADLVQQQGVFYARPEWTEGPRQAILDLIAEYVSVVCAADEPLIDDL